MLQEALIRHCSPTLAGLKTGSMFSVNTEGTDVIPEIRTLNRMLSKKGLRLIPLRKNGNRLLIYLYRPQKLSEDLRAPEAEEILQKKVKK